MGCGDDVTAMSRCRGYCDQLVSTIHLSELVHLLRLFGDLGHLPVQTAFGDPPDLSWQANLFSPAIEQV